MARAIGDPLGVGDLLRSRGGDGELGRTERDMLGHATATLEEEAIEWGRTCSRTDVGVFHLGLSTKAKRW